MYVTHNIYGPGVVIKAAHGTFVYVKFDRDTNLYNAMGRNVLAVSLNACKK